MLYDILQVEAAAHGIDVFELPLSGKIKGLYKDSTIAINKYLSDQIEKACILAEELGHHLTSVGNILDQTDIQNRRQELRARQWAYGRLVPLSVIVQAHHAKIKGRYEIAEFIGVTEEFLQASVDRYRDKYGLFVSYENYIIFLDPLQVVEVVA